eukprot:gnl/Hemi2/20311_TR6733_c0_g1_i1.p1 gnl/Hemi2/20311_TR6733_c0_g1~~gnl/Hemi2/20311_TR6733_c0_g1_i1.p1  ORF type:complete len:292 (-),score=103.97 gnl/Hemi2/20311_TR6733_c0_g1_i1:186-1061(-)
MSQLYDPPPQLGDELYHAGNAADSNAALRVRVEFVQDEGPHVGDLVEEYPEELVGYLSPEEFAGTTAKYNRLIPPLQRKLEKKYKDASAWYLICCCKQKEMLRKANELKLMAIHFFNEENEEKYHPLRVQWLMRREKVLVGLNRDGSRRIVVRTFVDIELGITQPRTQIAIEEPTHVKTPQPSRKEVLQQQVAVLQMQNQLQQLQIHQMQQLQQMQGGAAYPAGKSGGKAAKPTLGSESEDWLAFEAPPMATAHLPAQDISDLPVSPAHVDLDAWTPTPAAAAQHEQAEHE